jgi:hypothetical protein
MFGIENWSTRAIPSAGAALTSVAHEVQLEMAEFELVLFMTTLKGDAAISNHEVATESSARCDFSGVARDFAALRRALGRADAPPEDLWASAPSKWNNLSELASP